MGFLGYAFLLILLLFVVGIVSQALWDETRRAREERDFDDHYDNRSS